MEIARPKIELPKAGDTFAGKYRLVRVLGEGGMGVVYEALHLRLRQRVAIKALLPKMLEMADVVERFEREGRMAVQLHGRHVAKVLDVDVSELGLPYMVMEYLEGRDLDTEVGQRGALPIAEAVHYLLQACDAMKEAHDAGIVHRDLKPANLFLCPEGGTPVIKVLDFGISKSREDEGSKLTGTHMTVGTPIYMSPEQVRSARSVDLRTDIWSLGVILFELVTGVPPFSGSTTGVAAAIVVDPTPSLRALRPDVPEELEAAVFRALEKDPKLRFQHVSELADAIAPFAVGFVPVLHPPPASSPRLDERPTRQGPGTAQPVGAALGVAETVSSERLVSSMAARSAPATVPGWTQGRATGPKRGRTRAFLLVVPVVALSAIVAWRVGVAHGPSAMAVPSSSQENPTAAVAATPAPPRSPSPGSTDTEAPGSPEVVSAAARATVPGPSASAAPHRAPPSQRKPPPAASASPSPPPSPAPAPTAHGRPLFLP